MGYVTNRRYSKRVSEKMGTQLQVRCTLYNKESWKDAAEKERLSLGAWVKRVLDEACGATTYMLLDSGRLAIMLPYPKGIRQVKPKVLLDFYRRSLQVKTPTRRIFAKCSSIDDANLMADAILEAQAMTSEEAVSGQSDWEDDDPLKDHDFSVKPYWLLYSDRALGLDTIKDVFKVIVGDLEHLQGIDDLR